MLIIMQGVPGSGKSFQARKLAKKYNAEIFSTDDYFYEDGTYNYRNYLLPHFHQLNQKRSIDALKEGKSVIVDNCNVNCWNCKPYVEAAVELGIEVKFVRCNGDYDNIHGVPDEKIKEMRGQMEELTVESVLKSRSPWE